jgi:hypothetical protein
VGSFGVTNSVEGGVAGIPSSDRQEDLGGVAKLVVVPLSAYNLLLMAFVALPLVVVTDITTGVEDLTSIANRLIDLLVGVGGVGW